MRTQHPVTANEPTSANKTVSLSKLAREISFFAFYSIAESIRSDGRNYPPASFTFIPLASSSCFSKSRLSP